MAYNGAAVVAMTGKDCVAIASDMRFGIQTQNISTDFQKIFEMGPRLYIGLPGLATDVQTVAQELKLRVNLYELQENRHIKPHTLMSIVSNLLQERRFGPYFVEPVIAGLDPKTMKPFIASMDLVGCLIMSEDFVAAGTCMEQLSGMCESLWEPDMSPDQLFEATAQALLSAVDRDAMSGWDGIVHLIYGGFANFDDFARHTAECSPAAGISATPSTGSGCGFLASEVPDDRLKIFR